MQNEDTTSGGASGGGGSSIEGAKTGTPTRQGSPDPSHVGREQLKIQQDKHNQSVQGRQQADVNITQAHQQQKNMQAHQQQKNMQADANLSTLKQQHQSKEPSRGRE